MILIDANLLICAGVPTFEQHQAAREWLDSQLNGSTPVGLPWPSLLAFLRVVTNPRVFPNVPPMSDVWDRVVSWLGCDTVWIPEPTERHPEILERLLTSANVYGQLVPDAHLAALAIEHGLTLCTNDSGFARFPDLRWSNPLTGRASAQ